MALVAVKADRWAVFWAGRLVALNVEEGSRVVQGDVVARLDTRELEAYRDRLNAEVRAARATEKQARLAMERQRKLSLTEDVPTSALDSAEATYEGASASYVPTLLTQQPKWVR